jgi:hypothetical protein
MIVQIAWGIALILATTSVHAVCTGRLIAFLRNVHIRHWLVQSAFTQVVTLTIVVPLLLLASLAEAGIWAGAYVGLGALSHFEEALYFSTVTFTTLGFGDITLSPEWRLLGAIQAANGIVIFGWSTALVFALLQRMIDADRQRDEAKGD